MSGTVAALLCNLLVLSHAQAFQHAAEECVRRLEVAVPDKPAPGGRAVKLEDMQTGGGSSGSGCCKR